MLSGAAVSMVKDINQIDSSPTDLTTLDGKLFFVTTDADSGTEAFWASDGTSSGTVELMSGKEFTYPQSGGQTGASAQPPSSTYAFVPMGGKVYFTANDSQGTPGLYETDGTASGTTEVAPLGSPAGNLTVAGGKLFFTEQDSSSTGQLWVSDGSAAGTTELTSFTASAGSGVGELMAVGNVVYFEASDSNGTTTQLWTSDGTSAGTVELTDFGASGYLDSLTDLNGTLYFIANDGTDGQQLWTSDGTAPGTVAVTDFSGDSLYSLQTANGALYFLAGDGSSTGGVPDGSAQLWTSDGTSTGTVQLTDWPGGISQIGYFTAVGGNIFFTATDSSASGAPDGTDLWEITGGSAAPVTTSIPWAAGPTDLTALNDTTLLFWADGGNGKGEELWESNGTASGTVMVKDINPGPAGSYLSGQNGEYSLLVGPDPGLNQLTVIGGVAYFGADDGTHGDELWESDGTAAGTTLVKDIDPGPASSAPQYLTDLNGTLYFVAHDGSGPNQLWRSNGSAAGTTVVQDFTPAQTMGSYPANLTDVGGTLFFTADDGIDGEQLWTSNGTASGTTMLTDLSTTSGSAHYFQYLLDLNGKLVFDCVTPAGASTIYESDGTVAGTGPIFTSSSSISDPTVVGDSLYFLTPGSGSDGPALWVTDGTEAGTEQLVSFPSGSSLGGGQGVSSPTGALVSADGHLYFAVNNAGSSGTGQQLWTSNGTVAGTVEVSELGGSFSSYTGAVALGSKVVFAENDPTTASDTSAGESLWLSDGTASGTIELANFPPTGGGSYPGAISNLTVAGGTLYFTAQTSAGTQLWASNGTASGTIPLTSGSMVSGGFDPMNLTDLNGTLYFQANAADSGGAAVMSGSLWASNGTVAGTVELSSPGSPLASPSYLTSLNGKALFLGTDPATGDLALWTTNGSAGERAPSSTCPALATAPSPPPSPPPSPAATCTSS